MSGCLGVCACVDVFECMDGKQTERCEVHGEAHTRCDCLSGSVYADVFFSVHAGVFV